MDYVKLVNDGTYRKEDLSPEKQNFISGMECIGASLENYFSDEDFNGTEWSSTLATIQKEIAEGVVREIRDFIHITVCEMIVELADREVCEKEDKDGELQQACSESEQC